jgi:hypothetical protein
MDEDEDIRQVALQCITNVVDTFYEFIEPFVDPIKQITEIIMGQDANEETRKLAIEVWISIADQESYFIKWNREGSLNIVKRTF